MFYDKTALDDNNYPTDEFLQWIKDYDITKEPANELLQEALLAFQTEGRAWVDNDVYAFATLGWSGNEEIIIAMQENYLFWAMYWQSSERGGLHKFSNGYCDGDNSDCTRCLLEFILKEDK